MRVIGGEYRSRRLLAPAGFTTRPTSDRLRETLFNVLQPRVAGARFADLYAGSGAVGIEALSRGAAAVEFAETGAEALTALRANLRALGIGTGFVVETRGVARLLRDAAGRDAASGTRGFDIAFLDPPYAAGAEYAATLNTLATAADRLLRPGAVVVVEHAKALLPPEFAGTGPRRLARTRLLRQGDACLSFYALAATASADAEAAATEAEAEAAEAA